MVKIKHITLAMCLAAMLPALAQQHAHKPKDDRPVVGVATFSVQGEDKYARAVSDKIDEMLNKSKRFRVVNLAQQDKILAELERQKQLIDSENLAAQDAGLSCDYIVEGDISSLPVSPVYTNGNRSGYKAGVSFSLRVKNVETGQTLEATSFEAPKITKEMLTPESAIAASIDQIAPEVYEFFRKNFPLEGRIMRITDDGNGKGAKTVIVNLGKIHGLAPGTVLMVSAIEDLDGEELPTELGVIKVKELKGNKFSECEVSPKASKSILQHFTANDKMKCVLVGGNK